MLWLPVAFLSYVLNGLASVIDKALLHKRIPDPLTYAFYTGITSIGVFVLLPLGYWDIIPFDFSLLSVNEFVLAFTGGATLIMALYFYYIAIKENDATRVVPLVAGVFTPILTYLVASYLGTEVLSRTELLAFVSFVVGGIILMVEEKNQVFVFNARLLTLSFLSGSFFAFSFVATDVVMQQVPNFLNAFFWLRMGSVVLALLVLFTPLRKKIHEEESHLTIGGALLFLINKIIGALGFMALNYAIKVGPESLIAALKGTEYFFVFLISAIGIKILPKTIHESFGRRVLMQKFVGVLFITFGLYTVHIFG